MRFSSMPNLNFYWLVVYVNGHWIGWWERQGPWMGWGEVRLAFILRKDYCSLQYSTKPSPWMIQPGELTNTWNRRTLLLHYLPASTRSIITVRPGIAVITDLCEHQTWVYCIFWEVSVLYFLGGDDKKCRECWRGHSFPFYTGLIGSSSLHSYRPTSIRKCQINVPIICRRYFSSLFEPRYLDI